MAQNPYWEANNHSASQEITRLLWKLKAHYCVHKGPPLVPILSQKNPVHTFQPYFPNIHTTRVSKKMYTHIQWTFNERNKDILIN
jgi:hypothetical protein